MDLIEKSVLFIRKHEEEWKLDSSCYGFCGASAGAHLAALAAMKIPVSYTHLDVYKRQDLAWEKINMINGQQINTRTYLKNISYVISGVAASLLIMFALSFMGVFEKNTEVLVSMNADYGNRSEIVLPDGSVVKLNSGSEITYLYDPKEKIREVSFQGEGFFDVSKSKSPFVIKMAGGLSVKVWGPSFNLQAYVDDPVIQASLVEGCIELDSGSDKLVMKPGEMAVFDQQANKIKQVEGILSHSYGWLDNKLYMEDVYKRQHIPSRMYRLRWSCFRRWSVG